MRQNLFSGVDVSLRQTEREEARTHDDKTFFKDVIEGIDQAFSSPPTMKYTLRLVLLLNPVLHALQGSRVLFA